MRQTKENRKNKKSKITAKNVTTDVLIVLGLSGVIGYIALRDSEDPPTKLYDYGIVDWSLNCKGEDRVYRISSENTERRHDDPSLYEKNRDLDFLDENGKTLYRTSAFRANALDEEGVWRFHKHWDTRLFNKKDPSKVLKGDEEIFDIAEDLQSMTVTTTHGTKLKLSCVKT